MSGSKRRETLASSSAQDHYLKLYFGANGLELGKIRLKLREGWEVLSKHEE